jgi:hypothetical protein
MTGPRTKDDLDGSSAHSRFETRQWSGAMSRTLFGHLNDVYTLDCDDSPSEGGIREALRLRVMRDCGQSGHRVRDTVLIRGTGDGPVRV